jgi:hypothetical protein
MISFVALSLAMASIVAAQRSMTVGAIFGYFSSRSSRLHPPNRFTTHAPLPSGKYFRFFFGSASSSYQLSLRPAVCVHAFSILHKLKCCLAFHFFRWTAFASDWVGVTAWIFTLMPNKVIQMGCPFLHESDLRRTQ